MAVPILKRLVDPTVVTTTAATIFTATSKTLVRSIDISVSGLGSTSAAWVMLNSLSANFVYYANITAVGTYSWRGGLVMDNGDYLAADNGGSGTVTIVVNGATNLE